MIPKNRRMATTIVPKTVLGFTDKFDMASGNLTLRAYVRDARTISEVYLLSTLRSASRLQEGVRNKRNEERTFVV